MGMGLCGEEKAITQKLCIYKKSQNVFGSHAFCKQMAKMF